MVKSQPRARVRETMEDRITLGVFYVLLRCV